MIGNISRGGIGYDDNEVVFLTFGHSSLGERDDSGGSTSGSSREEERTGEKTTITTTTTTTARGG